MEEIGDKLEQTKRHRDPNSRLYEDSLSQSRTVYAHVKMKSEVALEQQPILRLGLEHFLDVLLLVLVEMEESLMLGLVKSDKGLDNWPAVRTPGNLFLQEYNTSQVGEVKEEAGGRPGTAQKALCT
ncbi:hypothetical protein Q7C36_003101 [Tachysurus vachellii]|uniref:Uncharacterized protein n=1 Tax=Tachysurus vachellii TaxID=175792 RepID=A0AA88NUI7_TACVA|nr:hypothetical protein Q7C36_003101 [Tachysurus vachellii]